MVAMHEKGVLHLPKCCSPNDLHSQSGHGVVDLHGPRYMQVAQAVHQSRSSFIDEGPMSSEHARVEQGLTCGSDSRPELVSAGLIALVI